MPVRVHNTIPSNLESAWLLDLSPLTHVGNPPEGVVDLASLVWLTLLALGLTAAAFEAFWDPPHPAGMRSGPPA
jgi:hypothetical protein